MSRYAGRFSHNRPFNRNTYFGAKTDNYPARNEYTSTYGKACAPAGENSYNYSSSEVDQAYQEPAVYGNESLDTQYDYQANAEYTEDYNTQYNTDNSGVSGDYSVDYSADYNTDYNAEYTEGYGDTTNYDYGYEQQSAEGYGYEQDSYVGQSAPVQDYHNYTSGGSSRGAPSLASVPSGASQFGNNRRGNYQVQKHFGTTGPPVNFSGRGRGRGRGQFNKNAGKKPPYQHWKQHGQFATVRGGHFDNSADNGGTGQFNLPSKNSASINIVTPSPAQKTKEEKKEGQFGLPKETAEPPISNETQEPISDTTEQTEAKQESKEKTEEQSVVKEELKEAPAEKTNDEEGNDDEDSDSSDEDTGFCKYCKLNFSTPKAYHTHTRGLQHTTLVMDAKAKKGDVHYQKEKVDASVLEVHIPEPKAPSPERDDDEEVEANWMNLDDDVVKFLKENKPENRDLNPNDVGKNPLPDDFNCPLCNVRCTGAGAFKMHIDGRQHKNNIEAAKQGAKIKKKKMASSGVMVETKERPSKFSEMAKDNQGAFLGLEFITEFQKTDFKLPPRYVCNLCESKCDGSTIIPHVVGLKHRLKYMQIKRPMMYDHLTKYNSKKKKSEMNANLEDFANEIIAEVGCGDVKIKVELESFEDEEELKETMIRHSKALAVKVREMEEGKIDTFSDETTFGSKGKEPPSKKPRMGVELATEWRSRSCQEDRFPDRWNPKEHSRPDDLKPPPYDKFDKPGSDNFRRPPYDNSRRPPYVDPKRPPYVDQKRPPYDDPRMPPHDDPRRLPHDDPRRPPHDDPRRPPYDDPRRPPHDDPRMPPYDDPRRPPYDDPRDPYYRRRYPEDFKASYRDRFDPYRSDDPMYERRMFDERRRLDGLMGERFRLDDTFAERKRVEDIMDRRQYLDELERSRVADILERRKRLQEEDVDYLRLKRFMGRESTAASSSPSLSVEEKTRLDSQLARREALAARTAPTNQEIDVRAPREELPAQPNQETDVQAIHSKLATHKSSDPNMAAKQEKAVKALQEEAAKNPNVNIGEVMANLSSSMIATEDDAAMALQISNALTQALLKYRIQNAPQELASITKSIEPMFEQKPVEPSIPGLGTSSTTSSSVPSFLRTSQHSVQSTIHPAADSNSSYLQTSVQGTLGLNMPQSSGNPSYLYTQQQSVPSSVNQQYSYTGYTQATESTLYPQYSQTQATASTGLAPVSASFSGVTPGIASHTSTGLVPGTLSSGVTAPPHVLTAGQGQKKRVVDTSNVDQPQKLLLESIRKQTELLKQKIQASVGIDSRTVNASVSAQSQLKHVPSSTHAASSSISGYNSSTHAASSVSSGYTSSAINQVYSAAGHTNSQINKTAFSQNSSQYHQYNYYTAPPKAAAQVGPMQPPLPSEPAPAPPLPTNDLPPIRRKKRN